jgi:hypothetical protein
VANLLVQTDLVVKRRPKLFEVRTGYDIYDAQAATALGTVEQVGRDNMEKLTRPKREDNAKTALEVRDASGPVLLMTHVQAAKSSLEVSRPDGIAIGTFRLQNLFGKSRFEIALMSEPDTKGLEVAARTWRNKTFAMVDGKGAEIASVEMTQGRSGDASHDNQYAVHVEGSVVDPVRALAFAAVFAIDTIVWTR